MREHSHCKCGKVINYWWWDWTSHIHETEIWDMCSKCRNNFIKEAIFMALTPSLPSTQKYFRIKETK
jgi:hypothetical protein